MWVGGRKGGKEKKRFQGQFRFIDFSGTCGIPYKTNYKKIFTFLPICILTLSAMIKCYLRPPALQISRPYLPPPYRRPPSPLSMNSPLTSKTSPQISAPSAASDQNPADRHCDSARQTDGAAWAAATGRCTGIAGAVVNKQRTASVPVVVRQWDADLVVVMGFGKAAAFDMRGTERIAAFSGHMLGSCCWRLGDAVVEVEERDLMKYSSFGKSEMVVRC